MRAAVFFLLLVPCIRSAAESGYYSVVRSDDNARTWSRSDRGLPADARINAFAATRHMVVAGTDEGIYVSPDQGVTWKPASISASGAGKVRALATAGEFVYAATGRRGILVSRDGGNSWVVSGGMALRDVRSLVSDNTAVYAGTDAHGVFSSRDGGRSWTSMSDGLPVGSQVFSMAAMRGKLFAGLYSKGLYVWTKEHRFWYRTGPVTPLVLSVSGDTLLAGHNPGGIYSSEDSGATWSKAVISFSQDAGKAAVWELGSSPDLALAGVSSRIYRSGDRGHTWEPVSSGLPPQSSGISFLVAKRFVLAGIFVGRK